jgi:two-component system nitrate/nitrite response regulator NarL
MSVTSQAPASRTRTEPKVGRRAVRVLIALSCPMDCQMLLAESKRARQPVQVVACGVSKSDVLHSFSRGNIDVALINCDLQDARLGGLEVLGELHASYPRTPVVILFDKWQDELVVRAFRTGAKGVLCRSEKQLDTIWKCMRALHEGQVWANSGQLQLLLDTLKRVEPIRPVASPGMTSLATRESQVANLVAEGLANKEIARRLGITTHTVSNYLFRIYNKLGISSRVELVLSVMREAQRNDAGQRPKGMPE